MNLVNKIKKLNYKKYFIDNNLQSIFPNHRFKIDNKTPEPYYVFDNNDKDPYPPEFKDLVRLHYIIRLRKITTVLEFGVGYSTLVMLHAIHMNKEQYGSFVNKNLRRNNAFKVYCIDTDKKYIDIVKKQIPIKYKNMVKIRFTSAVMSTFNGRICAEFKILPNVCPDFIYVDAPCFMHVKGNVNGIHTRDPDRTIISSDVLKLEHLLLPGTVVLWDGQTNNARFTQSNLQRKWKNDHLYNEDVSISEQIEKPLGPYNKRQINFFIAGTEQWANDIEKNIYR